MNEMGQRERVILAMEICSEQRREDPPCTKCPYYGRSDCLVVLLREALEVLRAGEVHVGRREASA